MDTVLRDEVANSLPLPLISRATQHPINSRSLSFLLYKMKRRRMFLEAL